MRWSEFRKQYGGADNRAALNNAVRAIIPGGTQLIDLASELQAIVRGGNAQRSAADLADMRWLLTQLTEVMDGLRDRIMARHISPPADSAKNKTHSD